MRRLLVALGLCAFIGFTGCGKKDSCSLHQLTDEELKSEIVGHQVYGFTNNSKKPYMVYLDPNGDLEMVVGGESFNGAYEIRDGKVYTMYTQKGHKPYRSQNKNSRYNPSNENHEKTLLGQIGVEYWRLDVDTSKKDVYFLHYPEDGPNWKGPCIVYKADRSENSAS